MTTKTKTAAPAQKPIIELADFYKIDAIIIRDTVWMNHPAEKGRAYGLAEVGHRQGNQDTWIYKVKTPEDAVELAAAQAALFGCPIIDTEEERAR